MDICIIQCHLCQYFIINWYSIIFRRFTDFKKSLTITCKFLSWRITRRSISTSSPRINWDNWNRTINQLLTIWYIGFIFCWDVSQMETLHIPTTDDHPHTFAYMNLIGDGVHNFIEGIIIGASYLQSIDRPAESWGIQGETEEESWKEDSRSPWAPALRARGLSIDRSIDRSIEVTPNVWRDNIIDTHDVGIWKLLL